MGQAMNDLTPKWEWTSANEDGARYDEAASQAMRNATLDVEDTDAGPRLRLR
jgi:hypothetical protein